MDGYLRSLVVSQARLRVPLVGGGTTEDKMAVIARGPHSGAGVSLKVDQPTPAHVLKGKRTVPDDRPTGRVPAGCRRPTPGAAAPDRLPRSSPRPPMPHRNRGRGAAGALA